MTAIVTSRAERPANGISSSTHQRAVCGTDVSKVIFKIKTETMAMTPMGPVRLSRMMSSICGRGRELKKPSAVSARPSICRAPDTAIMKITASVLATGSGKT